MKYHALFVIFEKMANFEIVVCCKLLVALYGLNHCMLDNCSCFCGRLLTFFIFLKKKSAVSNGLGPDTGRRSVGPDLDPNCLPLARKELIVKTC